MNAELELKQAEKSLDESLLAVARDAMELFSDLDRNEDGSYTLTSDDVHDMRALLEAWKRASDKYVAAVGKVAGTDRPLPEPLPGGGS